ncbi:trypsin-like peptidase domain-containing protein [Streptomyces liliiviolaceus]|uniref:trypsin-like peptidase domain-containing protein n=1 Tax=Streptomyces liliiviolaceus TaxID=2823109 RepID=UPI001FFCBE7C|nr:trypsin-like peptidase domain-containing protein [Streptomyces liliiviolaceus]
MTRETSVTAEADGAIHRDVARTAPDVTGRPAVRAGAAADRSLVRIRDLAGRPRGTGFLADHHGTVVTSHEAVDGLPRLVLDAPAEDRTCLVPADAVTALPALGLALVHCDGLGGLAPLPISVRNSVETGTYVRIAAGGWREARVLGSSAVTYTATDRFHLLDQALELAIGTAGSDALRLGGGAAGGPVVDAATGAVVAVLGTALHSDRRVGGFAVPLSTGGTPVAGPLADLLARNAATVPAYGGDLNLAGVLELTATVESPAGSGGGLCVERASVVREFTAFTEGPRHPSHGSYDPHHAYGSYGVLALVGAPGSGRTTELAGLAARRNQGAAPAPTLWLRGADLRDSDGSVADAARRTLERAGRIVTSPLGSRPEPADRDTGDEPGGRRGGLGDIRPERLARLAGEAGRPLLLLLDSPEEMPPGLAHRLPEWAAATAGWLRDHGVRLVVACRDEYWEWAGARFPPELLYGPRWSGGEASPELPACVSLGDLEEDEAREARARYGIPEGALDGADARHPLTLRLLSEVRAALSGAPPGKAERDEVFAAYLDLMCLRVAVRLAAANGLRGTAVRRLAARVAGQVHVAARRCLGPGEGELDRAGFETLFPWGPVPDRRLGGCTGWASAVLTEGLLVPAGDGYRFAHEEFADWIQGMHLDLDAVFGALAPRRGSGGGPGGSGSVGDPGGPEVFDLPRHRLAPVLQALLLVPRQQGDDHLTLRLRELLRVLDHALGDVLGDVFDETLEVADVNSGAHADAWWATRLLRGVLLRVPDATPYLGVLRHLAEHVVRWRAEGRAVPEEFGPGFWRGLPLPRAHRFDLLRRLVVADGAPPATEPRYLDTVSELLVADPAGAQPHLTHWFDDDRPLPATPDATVATAAQVLLHTHRHRAPDDLTEALVDSGHARADELLDVLAEEEPSALCRAVGRWVHDVRPARRAAAAAHALRTAAHVRTEADRELLRRTALALLARPGDCTLHGDALALLVRDPHTRARHLPQALARFRARDPRLPASALAAALVTHPAPVLAAFHDRLREPDDGTALRTLAEVTTPALARRVSALVREVVDRRPETAAQLAAHVDRRLEQGPDAGAVLHPLVAGLLDGGRPPLRAALAGVFAAPGTPASRPLRREFLDLLLTREHDPVVLDALVRAGAEGAAQDDEEHTRALVHTVGVLLVRTPDGATRFDRAVVDLGRRVPGFAALVSRWLAAAPEEWSTVVGPSTGRMIENLAGVRVPV